MLVNVYMIWDDWRWLDCYYNSEYLLQRVYALLYRKKEGILLFSLRSLALGITRFLFWAWGYKVGLGVSSLREENSRSLQSALPTYWVTCIQEIDLCLKVSMLMFRRILRTGKSHEFMVKKLFLYSLESYAELVSYLRRNGRIFMQSLKNEVPNTI